MLYLSSNIPSSIIYGSIFSEFLQIANSSMCTKNIYIYIYIYIIIYIYIYIIIYIYIYIYIFLVHIELFAICKNSENIEP